MKINRINFIFFFTDLFLLLFLFFIPEHKTGYSKEFKTTLINPKNTANISELVLSQNDTEVTLIKKEENWFIKEFFENDELLYPAEKSKIQDFISNLQKITTMYEISYRGDIKNFGFSTSNELSLSYFLSDGQSKNILFGNSSFSENNRYLMNENRKIYEANLNITEYLNANKSFWAEPSLISSSLYSSKDTQRIIITNSYKRNIYSPMNSEFKEVLSYLTSLNHGGICYFSDEDKIPEFEIVFENGDKSEAILYFYPDENKNSINVKSIYKNPDNTTDITCKSKISLWTYKQIMKSCRML